MKFTSMPNLSTGGVTVTPKEGTAEDWIDLIN